MASATPVGRQYGLFRVLALAEPDGRRRSRLLVRCECGTEKLVAASTMISGKTMSCGCSRRSKSSAAGMHKMPEYRIWSGMQQRCKDDNSSPNNRRYGVRGIRVCQRWAASFDAFLSDMGRRPSRRHQLDRIENDGDYESGNCRWVVPVEQQRNRSSNRRFEWDGKSLTSVELAARFGMSPQAFCARLKRGWTISEIAQRPFIAHTESRNVGSASGRAKLSESTVTKIRELASHTSLAELARAFGVSPTTVSNIVSRRIWSHVA